MRIVGGRTVFDVYDLPTLSEALIKARNRGLSDDAVVRIGENEFVVGYLKYVIQYFEMMLNNQNGGRAYER